MSSSPEALFAAGRWEEAAAIWARGFGAAAAAFDFAIELDPEQDLIGDAPGNRVPPDPRAIVALARRLRRRRPHEAALLESAALIRAGRPGRAERLLRARASARPRDPWCRLWLSKLFELRFFATRDGADLRRALGESRAAVRLAPGLGHAWAWSAALYASLDRYEESRDALARVLALEPRHAWALASRAELYSEAGLSREALADSDALIALSPEAGWPLALRGRVKARLRDVPGALADLAAAAERQPEYGEIRAWLGETRRRSGDPRGALRDLDRAASLNPRSPTAWLWRGKALLALGAAREAARSISRSIAIDPRAELAFAWRGEARFLSGDFRGASADFDRCHPLNPRRTWTDRANAPRSATFRADLDAAARSGGPWALALRGRLLMDGGGCDDARAAVVDLRGALRRSPGTACFRVWLATALWRAGRPEEAMKELGSARLRGDASALAWRGRLLLEADRRDRARGLLEKAARRLPEAGWARLWLGEALLASSKPRRALEAFDQAAARGVREPESVCLGAEACRRAGNPAEAARRLRGAGEGGAGRDWAELLELLCLEEAGEPAGPRFLAWTLRRPDLLWYFLRHLPVGADPLGLPGRGGLAQVMDRLLAARLSVSLAGFRRLRELLRTPPRQCLGLPGLAPTVRRARYEPAARALRAGDWLAACVEAEVWFRLGRRDKADALFAAWSGAAPAWTAAWRGLTRLWGGEERAALDDLRRALAADPAHRLARGWLGEALGKLGRLRESVPELDAALLLDEPSWRDESGPAIWSLSRLEKTARVSVTYLQALCRRGEAKLKLGDAGACFADLDLALKLSPSADWVHSWKGELMLWQGRREDAVAALSEAARLNPGNAWALGWLGGALVESGRWRQAIAPLTRALALDPFDSESLAWRAEAWLMTDRSARAIGDIMKAIDLDSKYHLMYRGRGDGRTRAEDLRAALDKLDRAVKGGGAGVWTWRAYLLRRLGRDAEAAASLERALARDDRDYLALAWRGELRLAQGDIAEAWKDLSASIRANPNYLCAYGWRARASLALGRPTAAEADFSRALALDQKSAWIFAGRGAARMLSGRLIAALADLDAALHLDPGDPSARSWRARCLLLSGRSNDAGRDYGKALAVSPGDPAAKVGLAWTLGMSGDAPAMSRLLDEALSGGSQNAAVEVESLLSLRRWPARVSAAAREALRDRETV